MQGATADPGTSDAGGAARRIVERGARGIEEGDVRRVVERADDITRRFKKRGPLARFLEDGRLFVSLARDYWSGRYRQVPFGTLAAVAFTLLYVLNPLDLVPDVLPFVGQLDDAAVFSAALLLVEGDLRRYRRALGGDTGAMP